MAGKIGEALISVLDEQGVPTMVKRCTILPPQSQMGPIEDDERDREVKNSLLYIRYNESYDRDSAYEFLQRRNIANAEAKATEAKRAADEKEAAKQAAAKEKQKKKLAKSVANSAAGTIGREIGNTVGKSVGGKFGKKLGGNIGATLGRGLLSTLFKL